MIALECSRRDANASGCCACRYFSGQPASALPSLPRPDGTVRPDFEQRLLNGSGTEAQYYQQYVRPATIRAFKQMQVSVLAMQD